MNRMVAYIGSAILAAGLNVGVFAHEGHHAQSDEGKTATIQGELIDTACFVSSDGSAKGKDHADCARDCMASGIPAGILPDGSHNAGDLLFLLTNPQVLAPYASQTIKVEGTVFADKHAVDVKHLYVKEGDGWKEVPLKDEHHSAEKSDAHTGEMGDHAGH